MHTNWFYEDLKEGEKWEKLAIQELQLFLPHTKLIKYDSPELRWADTTEHILTYEVKTRDHKFCCDDIAFETVSVVEEKKLGWYYRSTADILIYHWLNENGTHSEKLYVLGLKKLRKRRFLEEVMKKYGLKEHTAESDAGRWHTKFVVVPVKYIPVDCYIQGKPLVWYYLVDHNFEKSLWAIIQ